MTLIATNPGVPTLVLIALSVCGLHAEPEAAPPLSDALRPEHRASLETSEADLKHQLDTLAASEVDAESLKAIAEIRNLLALPRKEFADDNSLLGEWRVRSLQVSGLGAYAYPFFQCSIQREGKTGILFKKNTGSQRRFGLLARDGKHRFLFLGGSYYSDESPIPYSTLQDASVKADPERDSAGHLFQLEKGRLLLVFAAEGSRGEIYELKR